LKIKHPRGLTVALLLLALGSGALHAADAPMRIVTSIKPLQLLVAAIVEDEESVEVLLDPRMSPHDYQLRPSDRKKLDRADVVFWIGPEMEVFLVPVLSSLDRRTTVVALQRGDTKGDPHLWMDPLITAKLGYIVADALEKLAPTEARRWHANAARLEESLVAEDGRLREQFSAIGHPRGYLVAHDAYGRFEARYGLRHRAALTDSSDLPPSAQHIAQIENALQDGEISCVMREPSPPPKLLQTLLKGRQVRVEVVDAMGFETPIGRNAIVDFYRRLGRSISKCLEP
jgi:zinc transport system substrate-binding protein